MIYSWCLGLDPEYEDDAYSLVEAPVAGDYGWGSANQEVEPEDGEPAPEFKSLSLFGFLRDFCSELGNSQICNKSLFLSIDIFRLDFSPVYI